jgi:hypothetical protein
MPVEGLPTENAQGGEGANPTTNTPDAAANNTGAAPTGAATQTATTEAQPEPEKKFTQADIDRIVQNRLKSAVKAELKKLTGDAEVSVEDLQRQLSEERTERQKLMARQSVRDYLSDPKHKLNIPADAISEVEELVSARLEYDSEGKPSNLKDTVESLKARLPRLFANTQSNINANNGRSTAPGPVNMNDFVRQHAVRN